ncbi:hypothetical protein AAZX31_12G013600 [Glycine max]|uniref:Uncharacterized protein n=3 Tax=Glycine subgen. Soja TaxID=1462606 RepID=I1LP30_SOYBN|nr:uncharacterized protein LOC100819480 isoform X2 [Glycine max]XP_028195028.1 uncharacterized protein LOC114380229 isoform X1 [Glycine soja]KAG4966793.1 hypothetical protein JHK87_032444 [Glycine soja]KAG4979257.1 hypothetical protein JHK85_033215 [Glycine max]KAG4984912.1 hypothetical protein JHK86_032603 [Glycine max]KAG5118086.1 hypothetical protein JHK82_032506 [Glycine max]KAG5139071.1 hypothetical protein JHK84_032839 [Glycine max]|eukprot:XP_006592001.1 uncharacterized protein LOC100819480 isoform X1 [Glycine max]
MKPQTSGMSRAHKANNTQIEGPNWLIFAAGALLSTLSIRLGYKLKQALDSKPKQNATTGQKGNGKSTNTKNSADCFMQSNGYSLAQDNHGCFGCISGTGGTMELKCPPNGQMQMHNEFDGALPLVTVPAAAEFSKENGVWACSPDRLELPSKPFHHSNCSDSPCVSESGSDIFSKREVIQKLRQQLKRRDDMILEMQDQMAELQNSLNAQMGLSSHLQLQLDATNRDLFESKREIQRLRKAIADHCVGFVPHDKSSKVTVLPTEIRNGLSNGHLDGENNCESSEKLRDEEERIELLKRQVGELKEVIEGKEYLLLSYKEQKAELSLKIRELQQRLDSQLPNIL